MKNPIKVLFVDDDKEDFILIEEIFKEIPYQKYEIDWIDSFEGAKKIIFEEKHDIYLTDYYLGIYSGLDLIKKCLDYLKVYKPFILLTGEKDIITDQKAMQAGASDYLVKSTLSACELERAIRYSIKQAENIQQIKFLNETLEKRVVERTEELQKTNLSLSEQVKEKKALTEELIQSQELYKAIASNYPQGSINVINRNFEYVFLEGAEPRQLGLTPEKLIGTSFLINFEDPEKQIVIDNINMAFNGEYVNFELKQGNSYYLYSVVPLPKKEYINQVLLVSQNNTKLKEASLQTLEALEKEKMLNEMKSRFVSFASHEFRTPLGTILSSASLIARYDQNTHQKNRIKHVNRIKSSVTNLTAILNEFLSVSKLEEGLISINNNLFNLNELINEVLEEMSSITKLGQSLTYHHQSDIIELVLDTNMLKNILINLISNAIKYSPTYKMIQINSNIVNGFFYIEVKDNGIGIPKKDQENLFQRFFRASNATNIHGTGLGLNIVKRYVELLKGDISFESEEGKGTSFKVRIPI